MSRVITKFPALAAVLSGAPAAWGQDAPTPAEPPCALNGVKPVPALERPKAHLPKGEFAHL